MTTLPTSGARFGSRSPTRQTRPARRQSWGPTKRAETRIHRAGIHRARIDRTRVRQDGARHARARQAAAERNTDNVEFHQADAENLPIAEEAIDVALINGIFNLNHERDAILLELYRVLRQGGAVYAAELILQESLSAETCNSSGNWFA